jgi:hypothetical protein
LSILFRRHRKISGGLKSEPEEDGVLDVVEGARELDGPGRRHALLGEAPRVVAEGHVADVVDVRVISSVGPTAHWAP